MIQSILRGIHLHRFVVRTLHNIGRRSDEDADRAVVDRLKLTDYCLNHDHPRGRHKALVFETALGLTADDADQLIADLLDAARSDDAELAETDVFGQRYVIEFEMVGPTGSGSVRSAWIVRVDEDFPRFVSCYVI